MLLEICQLTGGRSYSNVNKHLAKARARVRLARLTDEAVEFRQART